MRGYYDRFNGALDAGDTAALEAASLSSCNCRKVSTRLAETLKRGRIVGNRISVTSLRIVEVNDERAVAEAVITAPGGRLLDPAGRQLEALQGETDATKLFLLNSRGGTWLVADVRTVA